jgi:hypothetical protein
MQNRNTNKPNKNKDMMDRFLDVLSPSKFIIAVPLYGRFDNDQLPAVE